MLQNVKNTTISWLLNLLMPYYCTSCGQIGDVLCTRCKKNIINMEYTYDPQKVIPNEYNSIIEDVIIFSPRKGIIKDLIDELKFKRNKAASLILAEILLSRISVYNFFYPAVLVPVPTINKHIRSRGYDQVELIAKHLAELSGLEYKSLLSRTKNYVQHEANRKKRREQSKGTYISKYAQLDPKRTYIIVDDILTTGYTMCVAAEALFNAGARHIVLLAVAYQDNL